MTSNAYKQLKGIYAETLDKITSSPDEWARFLAFSAKHSETPFINQVVVYATRPEAGKVLPLKSWNEDYSLWIRRGSKGIRVFDVDAPGRHTHYFDGSDTEENFFMRPLARWEAAPLLADGIARVIRDEYSVTGEGGIAEAVEEAVFVLLPEAMGEFSRRVGDEGSEAVREAMRAGAVACCMARFGSEDGRPLVRAAGKIGALALDVQAMGAFGVCLGRLTHSIVAPAEVYVEEHGPAALERAALLEKARPSRYNEDEGGERGAREGEGGGFHDDRNLRNGSQEVPAAGAPGDVQRDAGGGDARGPLDIGGGEGPGEVSEPVLPDARRAAGQKSEGDGPREIRGPVDDHRGGGARDGDAGRGLPVNGADASEIEQTQGKAEQQSFFGDDSGSAFSFSDDLGDDASQEPAADAQVAIAPAEPEEGEGRDAAGAYDEHSREETLEETFEKPVAADAAPHDFPLRSSERVPKRGPKERYRDNVEAIRVLRRLDEEGRHATAEEQVVLSRYVGWGGLSDAFDPGKRAWSAEFSELSELLTPEEYRAARESTLTAFFTPDFIAAAMYDALYDMGFHGGRILEPACGTGRFIGMLPGGMRGTSSVFGVEPDIVSGRIAAELYQTRNVSVRGIEETRFADGSFDVVVGNVPFGQFKVADPRYDKHNFMIHDYFFAKALDLVRPGGIVALITSKGTLDKESSSLRAYIAERAELLGAVRLPDSTFSAEAGTEVTSDIVFLQRREALEPGAHPAWLDVVEADGVRLNAYFAEHPEQIAGEMVVEVGRFGEQTACKQREGDDPEELVAQACSRIGGVYEPMDAVLDEEERDEGIAPADPSIRNFSYGVSSGEIFYRENETMSRVDLKPRERDRIVGLVAVRDSARELIDAQVRDMSDDYVASAMRELNAAYDSFTAKFGYLNAPANAKAFSSDASFPLVSSLEDTADDGTWSKAAIFEKRTVKPATREVAVETAQDALGVSIGDTGRVDLDHMSRVSGISPEKLVADLAGEIFLDPDTGAWITADEYLSGNVREKLSAARVAAEVDTSFASNVTALEAAQPDNIPAHEISATLGATWIPPEVVRDFVYELLNTPWNRRSGHGWARSEEIDVKFAAATATWSVTNKAADKANVQASSVYGTDEASAYALIEDALNLRDTVIRKTVYDPFTFEKKIIVNREATVLAQSKQETIKAKFATWAFEDPERRERLVRVYNDRFNSTVPRAYDGSNLKFPGMNSDVVLKKHQLDAVARQLYGGNTLLYHVVGSGKTFEMVAAAQEGKRLGFHSKSLFVVPNHLTEQTGNEYLRLYPDANILVATKKDFQASNRRRFCSRIATGDWDAVIIGHSQFEKIPMSAEYRKSALEKQLSDLIAGLEDVRETEGRGSFTVKEYERARKNLESKIAALNKQGRKDDVVTFEELGVDRLFVDEAHYYKNLFVVTKMRNVGGVQTTEAQKSSDLFMKTRWLDETTGGRGVTFATGTAVSNSMVELYTMQRYLQYPALERMGLSMFDMWASTFGEQTTAIELSPDGRGYRAKTRFSRFHNLPELMNMFKDVADVQTADMLDLPVPEAHIVNVKCEPTEFQRAMVEKLGERADAIRAGGVDPRRDNMLNVTNDGRKLALDQRLIDPALPDNLGSKVSIAADNVFRIWEQSRAERLTQLVFCDLSTPKGEESEEFSVYDDMKAKLIDRGVPEDEVAFIHDAATESAREALFDDVRRGAVRVLLGSTFKMGAGTNVQDRLVAIHNLDCPWRPADLEQRAGRIVRQGNMNKKVEIYRYVTEGTFDSYLYQTVENKQRFISQVFTSSAPGRVAEDVDEAVLDYAEVKALASGNPLIKEKIELDARVPRLRMLRQSFMGQRFDLETKVNATWPKRMRSLSERIERLEADMATADAHPAGREKFVGMRVGGAFLSSREEAGEALMRGAKANLSTSGLSPFAEYRGFKIASEYDYFRNVKLVVVGDVHYTCDMGKSPAGNVTRIDNLIDGIERECARAAGELESLPGQIEAARVQIAAPFPQQAELDAAEARLAELNVELNLDERASVAMGEDKEEDAAEAGYLEFDLQQKIQVNKGARAGLPPEAMRLFADPRVDSYVMETIREELEAGTDPEALAPYIDFDDMFKRWELAEIARGIREGVDVSLYAKRGVSSSDMSTCRRALAAGIDVRALLDKGAGWDVVGVVFEALEFNEIDLAPYALAGADADALRRVKGAIRDGFPQDVVDYVAATPFESLLMHKVEAGLERGWGLREIKLYARDDMSWRQCASVYDALAEGTDPEQVAAIAAPDLTSRQIDALAKASRDGVDVCNLDARAMSAEQIGQWAARESGEAVSAHDENPVRHGDWER